MMGSSESEYVSAESDEYADCSDTSVEDSQVQATLAALSGKPLKPSALRSRAEKSEEEAFPPLPPSAVSFSRLIAPGARSAAPRFQKRISSTATTTTIAVATNHTPSVIFAASSSASGHRQTYRRKAAPRQQNTLASRAVEPNATPILLTAEEKALMKERKQLLRRDQKLIRASFDTIVAILKKIAAFKEELEQKAADTQQKIQPHLEDMQKISDKVVRVSFIAREAAGRTGIMKLEDYASCRNQLIDLVKEARIATEEAEVAEKEAEEIFALAKQAIKKIQDAKQPTDVGMSEMKRREKKQHPSSASASKAKAHQVVCENKPGKIKQALKRVGHFIYQHPVFTIISAFVTLVVTAYMFRESFQQKTQESQSGSSTVQSTSTEILAGLSTAAVTAGNKLAHQVRQWVNPSKKIKADQGVMFLMSKELGTKKDDNNERLIKIKIINHEPYKAKVAFLKMFHHIEEQFQGKIKFMLENLPLIMLDMIEEGEPQTMRAAFGAGNIEGLYMKIAQQPNEDELTELAKLLVKFWQDAGFRMALMANLRAHHLVLQEQRKNGYLADTEGYDTSLRMR